MVELALEMSAAMTTASGIDAADATPEDAGMTPPEMPPISILAPIEDVGNIRSDDVLPTRVSVCWF